MTIGEKSSEYAEKSFTSADAACGNGILCSSSLAVPVVLYR